MSLFRQRHHKKLTDSLPSPLLKDPSTIKTLDKVIPKNSNHWTKISRKKKLNLRLKSKLLKRKTSSKLNNLSKSIFNALNSIRILKDSKGIKRKHNLLKNPKALGFLRYLPSKIANQKIIEFKSLPKYFQSNNVFLKYWPLNIQKTIFNYLTYTLFFFPNDRNKW